jgi:hypothetical protein
VTSPDDALVAARTATDNGQRTDLDAVIEAFGLTRELLADGSDIGVVGSGVPSAHADPA